MNIDQDQTNTNETGNSGTETNSENREQGSDTSTTGTGTQERIDLASDDTQTEDTRTPEQIAADEAAETERATLFGAPAEGEDYTIEGLPEGMEIDKEALDAVTPAFRELGLSSKGASKVAAVYAEKVLPKVMERATQSIETQVLAQRATWEGEALAAVKANGSDLKNKAGEVLSFDAKDISAVRATAAKALDKLAPPEFREFLQDTGLSVHPFMVAFAYQAGKLLAEDTEIEQTETGRQRKPAQGTRKSGGLSTEKFYS